MSYFSSTSSISSRGEAPLMLGHGGNSSLSWCPSLNIYRVNRFNILTNDRPANKRYESHWIRDDDYRKFDIIEELLMHNLVHVTELIFDYVGFPWTWSCCRVSRLWYELIAGHIFPRWADKMIGQDASLQDIYADGDHDLMSINPGKICWQVYQLKEVWQSQRPKLKRLSCDSFVLSIKVHQEKYLYCGLNNGSLQLWDLDRSVAGTSNDKLREEEDMHEKGIKVRR